MRQLRPPSVAAQVEGDHAGGILRFLAEGAAIYFLFLAGVRSVGHTRLTNSAGRAAHERAWGSFAGLNARCFSILMREESGSRGQESRQEHKKLGREARGAGVTRKWGGGIEQGQRINSVGAPQKQRPRPSLPSSYLPPPSSSLRKKRVFPCPKAPILVSVRQSRVAILINKLPLLQTAIRQPATSHSHPRRAGQAALAPRTLPSAQRRA